MHKEPRRRPEDCIGEMLRAAYGEVYHRHTIYLDTKPEDYADKPFHPTLSSIYSSLENHRNFRDFVKNQHVIADFFIPNPGFVVECDESQHFTQLRRISLEHYPEAKRAGFLKEQWISRCNELDRHDNQPLDRDEKRAWYDTLRDFLPEIKGFLPTIRLYAEEKAWCRMDPQNPDDVKEFKNILASKGSKIGLLEDINFPVTQTPIDPVLDEMIRFEYLTNIVKLQYLSDCTTGEFDYNSRYLGILKENARLLNSGGEPFKVYLNRHFRNKGYFGPLFSDRDPWEYESIADLNQVNGTVKNLISCSENWFALFCEYTLIKTSLHELTADIHDPENIDKYGYPDLMYLHDLEKEPGLSGEKLRNFVVSCLNLGIDPSENQGGVEQEVSHLAACKYAEVQSRRKEWIKQAWHSINRIKAKMSVQNISSVMLWQSYALCAYETGPVFIRKNRDFLLPRIARSFETYEKWDQARLRENMYEIIGKDVTFVIENYWDHFNGKLTVDFLKGNSDLSIEIKNAGEQLNSIYREINLHIDLNDSPGSGIPGIIFLRPKKDPIKDTRDTSETDSSKRIKSSGKNWTESGFLAELLENTGSEKNIETAKKLIEWAKGQRLQLGEKFKNQSFIPYIGIWPNTRQFFIIKTNGKFAFDFKHFNDYPFLESEEKRRELVNQLNTLKGVHFRESSIKDLKYPSYDLKILEDSKNFDAFITMSTWFFDELRNGITQ